MSDLKFDGFADLDQALSQLPEALRRPVALSALRKASEPMVAEARRRAPRGKDPKRRGSTKDRRTGRSATLGPAADTIRARAVRAESRTEATVSVGAGPGRFYLKYSEFGTSRQPARPFLRPAFESHKSEALDLLGVELWKSLTATARRLVRQAERGKLTRAQVQAFTR